MDAVAVKGLHLISFDVKGMAERGQPSAGTANLGPVCQVLDTSHEEKVEAFLLVLPGSTKDDAITCLERHGWALQTAFGDMEPGALLLSLALCSQPPPVSLLFVASAWCLSRILTSETLQTRATSGGPSMEVG